MTDLLHIIPDFPIKSYDHLIPRLEQHLVTTIDLLTLDAVEIHKRTKLGLVDVQRLAAHVTAVLQQQLDLRVDDEQGFKAVFKRGGKDGDVLRRPGNDLVNAWSTISTLDEEVDAVLGGGIPAGYITEITGERYVKLSFYIGLVADMRPPFSGAGKTQFLLTLLLSVQLPPPHGLSRSACYISTEHPLPTTRLSQILSNQPLLSRSPSSYLSRILTLQTPDLESQDHILTYQLPVALAKHNVGLVVIDSIAANYRAETSTTTPDTHMSSGPQALAQRSTDLIRLGRQLQDLARIHKCAVVVSNQVADRFAPLPLYRNISLSQAPSSPSPMAATQNYLPSSLGNNPAPCHTPHISSSVIPNLSAILSLDHQQRFFTGWGDHPQSQSQAQNLKTPSLSLSWANQIACRIALVKELSRGEPNPSDPSVSWTPQRWRRYLRVVFAPWVAASEEGEKGIEVEVWSGGMRAKATE